MSEAQKMADYLGFEVVYLDGFGYIKEQGEQGPEIKREATLEERTLWTELGAVSEELEALKRAISEAEPVAWSVEGWSGAKRIATSLHHSVDDAKTYAAEFSQHYPTIHTLPLYKLKGIK